MSSFVERSGPGTPPPVTNSDFSRLTARSISETMTHTRPADRLTIVTPTYEKHAIQFTRLVESIVEHCQDLDAIHMLVVIERANEPVFREILSQYPRLSYAIFFTEDVLESFGITVSPTQYLRQAGKFTFQSLKKLGALREAPTAWSLVLDSEGLFHKPFRAIDLLADYADRKYVFYTRTAPRTDLWRQSTGYQVTLNAGRALAMPAGDRWYMEYFHWFYETEKVCDLLENRLGEYFFQAISSNDGGQIDFFENILYYLYIERYHSAEYRLIDLKEEIDRLLPDRLSRRFDLSQLPFSLFGNEYILNILGPEEVSALGPLFAEYRLPFVRLEPPFFHTGYLPELKKLPTFVATISSHHLIWLRKKVAVCISGEFRHVVHRTPEGQIRQLLSFLSGVECDLFVHSWSNTSEALILHELKPRAYHFEPRPSMAPHARQIQVVEPNIKPGRDEGSLSMFYSMEQCFKLVEPYLEDYDYILRIRPDLMIDGSLKEMMVRISDEGDFLPNTIYVPQHFHSKGVNDQLALGPAHAMAHYLTTYSWVLGRLDTVFFNPESVLLRHLLEEEVGIALVDVQYALMRHHPMRIGLAAEFMHEQRHVWWSRTDRLPLLQDLSAYFADKLKAMQALMQKQLPRVLYVPAEQGEPLSLDAAAAPREFAGGAAAAAIDDDLPAKAGALAVVRARAVDNDPALWSLAIVEDRRGGLRVRQFHLREGKVVPEDDGIDQVYRFAWPEGEEICFSEWRLDRGRLVNNKLRCTASEASKLAREDGPRRSLAWMVYRLERWHKHRRQREGRARGQLARLAGAVKGRLL